MNFRHDYQSAIGAHLAANSRCQEQYSDTDFSILTCEHNKHHLKVLEAIYIRLLNLVLCKQNMSVEILMLFSSLVKE